MSTRRGEKRPNNVGRVVPDAFFLCLPGVLKLTCSDGVLNTTALPNSSSQTLTSPQNPDQHRPQSAVPHVVRRAS